MPDDTYKFKEFKEDRDELAWEWWSWYGDKGWQSTSAIHMVSAWATKNHISLGQVVVDEKSNEITAIPQRLEILDVSGSVMTIDAMGCQVEIAQAIVDQKSDYVLAVKGNQPTLHEGIHAYFDDHAEGDFARVPVSRYETHQKSHGRDETRVYRVCPTPEDLPDCERWPKLKGRSSGGIRSASIVNSMARALPGTRRMKPSCSSRFSMEFTEGGVKLKNF